jgi:hypothetical protein
MHDQCPTWRTCIESKRISGQLICHGLRRIHAHQTKKTLHAASVAAGPNVADRIRLPSLNLYALVDSARTSGGYVLLPVLMIGPVGRIAALV